MQHQIDSNLILGRLEAGTLLRHEWGDGHKCACLLGALAPQCAEKHSFRACPTNMMPTWLAALTLSINDKGTDAAWEPFVRRFATVAARWHLLDEAGWRRALLGSLSAILEIARERDPSGACDTVIALCREGAAANDPRWEAMATDAAVAARAAEAAAWATGPALTRNRTTAEIRAAIEAEWDRMTDGILSAIEVECDRTKEKV